MIPDEEARITLLEEKVAHQEYAIGHLGDALYRQQSRLDSLENVCEELLEQVRRLREGRPGEEEEGSPPHY